MRIEVLKQLLDACHLAKKSIETMPKLPKGMKPRHVHVMDVIGEMEDSKGSAAWGMSVRKWELRCQASRN